MAKNQFLVLEEGQFDDFILKPNVVEGQFLNTGSATFPFMYHLKNLGFWNVTNSGNFDQFYSNWTIFGGFVAILAKKEVIFGPTLETTILLTIALK